MSTIWWLIAASLLFVAAMTALAIFVNGTERFRRYHAFLANGRGRVLLACISTLLFTLATAFTGTLFGKSITHAVLDNLPMICIFIGMGFMNLARFPIPDSEGCTACKYSTAGLPAGTQHCPECGADLTRLYAKTAQRFGWNRGRMAVAAFFVLPFAVQIISIPVGGIGWWDTQLVRLLPTASLIHDVTHSKSFTMNEWAELGKRTLSQRECDRVALGLMNAPDAATRLASWSDGGKWFNAAVASGQLSKAGLDSVLANLVTIETSLDSADAAAPKVVVRWTLAPSIAQGIATLNLDIKVLAEIPGSRPDQLPASTGLQWPLQTTPPPTQTLTLSLPNLPPADHVKGIVYVALRPAGAAAANTPAVSAATLPPADAIVFRLVPFDIPLSHVAGAK